ncbi:hypothetical protein Tco_1452347 [Tanacetum coccineum]
MLSRISFSFLYDRHFDVLYYLGHMFRPLDFFYVIHVDLIIGSRCRHNVEEKITLEDLFFLHSMNGGEMVDDEATVAEARRAQDEAGGVRRHPNMSFTNRLRAMDERIGDMDTNIFKLRNDVEELTAVVSEMSEQYDQFYRELNSMREEQQRFHAWETDHLSQLLAHHHIGHTRFDSTQYSYVPDIPDLGVQ